MGKLAVCAASVVIGGADGPTSVFLAGKIDGGFVSTVLIAVAIVFGVIAVVQIVRKRRKK